MRELRSHMFFKRFPREIAVRGREKDKFFLRRKVRSLSEALRVLSPYNGSHHLYIGVYLDNVFDKFVIDIDAKVLSDSWHTLKVIYNALPEEIPKVTFFSGKKGFHVYLLFLPWTAPNSETLKFMIDGVRNYVVNTVGEYDKEVLEYLDFHHCHARGMIRLPGSIHPETGNHVLPINPEWSLSEVLEYTKKGEEEWFPAGELEKPRPQPHKYMEDKLHVRYAKRVSRKIVGEPPVNVEERNTYKLLSKLVRPCIAYYAHSPDCDHFIRTQLVLELGYLEFNTWEIRELFISKLGWSDYDPRKTTYHVDRLLMKVRARKLVPASCKTLQRMGYCLGEKCPYYPNKHNHWWYMLPRGG